jgi:putative membrane protein
MTVVVWDAGLQNERTSLAWSRSALSLLACGLLTARLAAEWHSVAGISTVVLAGALFGVSHRSAQRRYVRASRCLDEGQPLPDGRQGAILLGGLLALGVLATLLVIGRLLGTAPVA